MLARIARLFGYQRVTVWLPVDDSFGNDKFVGVSMWERI